MYKRVTLVFSVAESDHEALKLQERTMTDDCCSLQVQHRRKLKVCLYAVCSALCCGDDYTRLLKSRERGRRQALKFSTANQYLSQRQFHVETRVGVEAV